MTCAHQLFRNDLINLLSPPSNPLCCIKIIHIECALQLCIKVLRPRKVSFTSICCCFHDDSYGLIDEY